MRDGVLASRTLRFVSILRAAARIPLFQSERCARSHLFALLGLSSVADAASLKQRKAAPGYFAQGPTERIRIDETGRTEDYHLYHGRGGGATARIRHSGPHTLYAYTFFFFTPLPAGSVRGVLLGRTGRSTNAEVFDHVLG